MYRAQLFHPDPFAQDLVMLPRRYLPDIQGLLLDEPLDWFPKASETTWGLQQTLTFFGTAESSGKGALLANPHYVACYVILDLTPFHPPPLLCSISRRLFFLFSS